MAGEFRMKSDGQGRLIATGYDVKRGGRKLRPRVGDVFETTDARSGKQYAPYRVVKVLSDDSSRGRWVAFLIVEPDADE